MNLSRSVLKKYDERLLSEPSNNKAGGYKALTELLNSMQKQLNSLRSHVKDIMLDNNKSRQSFPNYGRKFKPNKCQDCLANNRACVTCFICEGHIVRRCQQKGKGQGLTPSSVGTQEMLHRLFCGNKDYESVFKLCGACEVVRYCCKVFQKETLGKSQRYT